MAILTSRLLRSDSDTVRRGEFPPGACLLTRQPLRLPAGHLGVLRHQRVERRYDEVRQRRREERALEGHDTQHLASPSLHQWRRGAAAGRSRRPMAGQRRQWDRPEPRASHRPTFLSLRLGRWMKSRGRAEYCLCVSRLTGAEATINLHARVVSWALFDQSRGCCATGTLLDCLRLQSVPYNYQETPMTDEKREAAVAY